MTDLKRSAMGGAAMEPIRRQAEQPPMPRVTEPAPAPEILIDGYSSVSLSFGVAKFACYSMMRGEGDTVEQRTVVRLAMSIGAVALIHEAFGRLLDELRSQGQIVSPEK